jgi:hypothetical protein
MAKKTVRKGDAVKKKQLMSDLHSVLKSHGITAKIDRMSFASTGGRRVPALAVASGFSASSERRSYVCATPRRQPRKAAPDEGDDRGSPGAAAGDGRERVRVEGPLTDVLESRCLKSTPKRLAKAMERIESSIRTPFAQTADSDTNPDAAAPVSDVQKSQIQ